MEASAGESYLTELFQALDTYQLAQAYKKHNLSATQGEILYGGIEHLVQQFEFKQHDVFFDLGCGLGKIVLQVFLTTPVKAACGIEFLPELHHQTLEKAKQVQKDWPGQFTADRQLDFILGDFLQTSFASASLILLNSTCFNQATLQQLSLAINNMPQVRAVFSLRPLPLLKHLRLKQRLSLECNWDSTLCYIYTAP